MSRSSRNKKRHGRIGVWVICVTLLLVIGGVTVSAIVFGAYSDVKKSADKTYKETNTIKSNKLDELASKKTDAQIGILLLGLDNDGEREKTENLDGNRSDSMLYVVYDGKNKVFDMVSIPRDTYAEIYDGKGTKLEDGKINSAYSYNQLDGAIETVSNTFGLPVDYYATVNFISFKKIVDAVGGVEVDVPFDISSNYAMDDAVENPSEVIIHKGVQRLNGEDALTFSRIRKYDNDIKRGERQMEVLQGVMKETLQIKTINTYQEILNSVEDDVETNLTFQNMLDLASGMVNINDWKINSYTFDWSSGNLSNGQSVVYINDDSEEYITHKLKVNLGLESPNETDEPDYVFNSNGYSTLKAQTENKVAQ